jgi:hypothetical protein
LAEAEELAFISGAAYHLKSVFLTVAKSRKISSCLNALFVLLDSFTAKRAINVETTSARSIQETTLMMVPRLSGVVVLRRLRKSMAIIDTEAMMEYAIFLTDEQQPRQRSTYDLGTQEKLRC